MSNFDVTVATDKELSDLAMAIIAEQKKRIIQKYDAGQLMPVDPSLLEMSLVKASSEYRDLVELHTGRRITLLDAHTVLVYIGKGRK